MAFCPCQSVTSRATSSVCARLSATWNSLATASRMSRCRSAGGLASSAATGSEMPGLGVLGEVLGELLGEVVERVGVLAQLLGGAGERLGDAGTELLLHDGQHGAAHPHPRERAVVVLRVEPRLEPGIGARLHGRGAADAEQRPHGTARSPRHALQARRPAAPREPEQHGLGLVVEGVAEQHGDAPVSSSAASSASYRARRAAASGPPGPPR